MKVIKKHGYLVFKIYLPIFLLCLGVLLFAKQYIPYIFAAHWAFFMLITVIGLSPQGKFQLGDKQQRKPVGKWLGLLLLGQIALCLLFFGFTYLFFYGMPIHTPTSLPTLAEISTTLSWHWGLFPWGAITFLSVAFGYICYQQKQRGLISSIFAPLFHNTHENEFGLSVDYYIRLIPAYACAFATALFLVSLLVIIANLLGLPLFSGISIGIMLVATVVLIIIAMKSWAKSVRYFSTNNTPFAVTVFIYCAFLVILLLLAGSVIAFTQNFQLLGLKVQVNKLAEWHLDWEILMGMWWFAWVPLFSAYNAFISRGYNLRHLVFGSLIIPMILCTVPIYANQIHLPEPSLFAIAAIIIGMLILAILFLRKNYFLYFMRGVLPATHEIKDRPAHNFTVFFIRIVALLALLYLLTGIYFLSSLTFILIFPVFISMFILLIAFLRLFLSRK